MSRRYAWRRCCLPCLRMMQSISVIRRLASIRDIRCSRWLIFLMAWPFSTLFVPTPEFDVSGVQPVPSGQGPQAAPVSSDSTLMPVHKLVAQQVPLFRSDAQVRRSGSFYIDEAFKSLLRLVEAMDAPLLSSPATATIWNVDSDSFIFLCYFLRPSHDAACHAYGRCSRYQ
jgi:hypothetical protein